MGMRLRGLLGLTSLAVVTASVWVLHAQWSRAIEIAEMEAAAELRAARGDASNDSYPRIPVRPDAPSPIDLSPLLDRTPLFLGNVPTGFIGSRVVLEVRILRFATARECIDGAWDASTERSVAEKPSQFALADVLSVKRGEF